MKPPPRLAAHLRLRRTITTIGGVAGMAWPDGAIDIGCAEAAVPANNDNMKAENRTLHRRNSETRFRDAVQGQTNTDW